MIRLVVFCVRVGSIHPKMDVVWVSCLVKHAYYENIEKGFEN